MTRRAWSAIPGVLAALVVAGCGGGGGDETGGTPATQSTQAHQKPASAAKPSSSPSADYAKALKAARDGDYDTAIALMSALGGYRDAPKQVERIKVIGARAKLADARRKLKNAPSPQSAIALAKTSLKYHPTPQARSFLRHAQVVHDRFKRRQAKGLEER